ncbi:MAG: energy-coupling factor transporter transmembrane component T [Eubacteriales bacterium]
MKEAFLTKLDLRVCLFLTVIVATLTLSMQKEIPLLSLFILLEIWLLLYGLKKEALSHFVWYGVLWGSLYALKYIPIIGSTALPLVTVYIRRMMLSIMVARPMLACPNGQLVATFHALKFPREATIATTLIFRFLPTISQEYRQIRDAQKFRDIGVDFFSIILHPIKLTEYTLVPMLIRTSKTADELAASASVRGVGSMKTITCYYQVKFTAKDYVVGGSFFLVIMGIFALEKLIF